MKKIAIFIFSFLLVATSSAQSPLGSNNSDEASGLSEKDKQRFADANPEDITNENFPDKIESFDYPKADILDVVKAISKLTGKNFIVDPGVRGKITIVAQTPITVAEAYRAFLSALAINNFTVVPSGKFLKIRPARIAQRDSIETYSGKYHPDTDQMITKIYQLKYISAEEIERQLRILHSKEGEMKAYSPTNTLIISDYGSNIERITNILSQLDVPGFEEQMEVIPIKFAKAKDIADLITSIINKDSSGGAGRSSRFRSRLSKFRRNKKGGDTGSESFSVVLPDERTNSIIVVGTKAGIEKIQELVTKLDFKLRPEDAGGVYVYYVRHGDAEKIAQTLGGIAEDSSKATTSKSKGRPSPESEAQAVFGGDVKVTASKDTNSLLITASRQDYEVVESILEKIDIPRDQVYVEAYLAEMTAADKDSVGIDYYKFAEGTNGIGRSGFRSGSISDLVNLTGDKGLILGFGSDKTVDINIGGQTQTVPDLLTFFNILKSHVNVNILSTPQITAMDNEEAEIEVGSQVPVGTKETQGTGGISTSIERKDATIKLTITPHISAQDEVVRLKIDQSVQQLSNQQVKAQKLNDSAVVTTKRAIKTSVSVRSGDTVVLGGLMTEKEEEVVTKVPLLGDIPILGWLFKGRQTEKEKVNLLIFITPRIIRNAHHHRKILSKKMDERVDFVKKNLGGRDPFGKQMNELAAPTAMDPAGPTLNENGLEEEETTSIQQ